MIVQLINFYIDKSVLTFHSPEIEFDEKNTIFR